MTTTRVVLADDHAVVRAGIRNALHGVPGLQVVGEASNGPELMAVLRQFRPALALIDVTMPDFDPLPAVRQIRADYPEMKILIISAYDDDVYVRGLLSAGADGYHLKDQPLDDLRLAVQRVLDGERWISSPLVEKLVAGQTGRPLRPTLSARQRDILRLLQQGHDNRAIAQQLSLSAKTVENHLTRLYRRLEVKSRLEAVTCVMNRPELLGISGSMAAQDSDPAVASPVDILIVDDNARYRGRLRRMVAKAGRQVTIYEAGNLADALHLARKVRPRLALVDVVLDDESGIQCVRRLQTVAPSTRVILISAYPDREFRRSGLAAGAVAFLDKKDLDIATLRQVIEDAVVV